MPRTTFSANSRKLHTTYLKPQWCQTITGWIGWLLCSTMGPHKVARLHPFSIRGLFFRHRETPEEGSRTTEGRRRTTGERRRTTQERSRTTQDARRIENFAIWAVDTDWLIRNSFLELVSTMPECNEDNLRDCEFLTNFDQLFVENRSTLVFQSNRLDQIRDSQRNRAFFCAQA